jgi:hypothetical protein
MYASMARRIASARPTVLLELMMSKVDVVNRPRPGIEERTREARQRLGPGFVAGCCVAGREDDPVFIELQLRHPLLAMLEQIPMDFTHSLRA